MVLEKKRQQHLLSGSRRIESFFFNVGVNSCDAGRRGNNAAFVFASARRGSCGCCLGLLWAAKWRSREPWGLPAGGGEERRVGGGREGGGILGSLVQRVRDGVAGLDCGVGGGVHEWRMERWE